MLIRCKTPESINRSGHWIIVNNRFETNARKKGHIAIKRFNKSCIFFPLKATTEASISLKSNIATMGPKSRGNISAIYQSPTPTKYTFTHIRIFPSV